MTRIVSYNILAGGYSLRQNGERRSPQLTHIIRSAQPDIVGVVEATHEQMKQRPLVIEEIAEALDMQLIKGGHVDRPNDYPSALLTRLPVVYSRVHARPGVLERPLLEVCVEESDGQQLTVFVVHLSAAFSQGWAGDHLRQREVREILRITAPLREEGRPHVLIGDFNSLAPGDPFKASALLRYIVHLDATKRLRLPDGHPHLNFVVPPRLRFLNPLLRAIPRSKLLSMLFDAAAYCYAPRGTIRLLRAAGYIDCYRRMHPHSPGFTCPAGAPAGRIDYIFASPTLAARLASCSEITESEGLPGSDASDHLPVMAEFGTAVQPVPSVVEWDSATARMSS
ncbi:MAG TPA: endonuclease/exonuclease/phosphatase family protein [Ktedonobacteraceae bacterium]|jgi:endonuclease/exonuclease/phosphatase family metal-dependent hydrolase|nr:endonuclease/exonuclease/phosphatase family protein [Ktedonobacteraceae bacterium]